MRPAKSDHFEGGRFVNPTGSAGQPFSAVPRMLLEPRTPWPERVDEPPQPVPGLDGAAAVVTFIGHATFLIQTAAGNILTDPMFSCRAGPLNMIGPRRVRQPAVPFDDLPSISIVLLSHNHYDHCDLRTLRKLARLVAGREDLRAANRADPGAALLRADSVRSKPCLVGGIHAGGRWRAHLLCR
jgi:glyoxylase-like metal-dependent hydrolase (beta-lactamase superfamily II)